MENAVMAERELKRIEFYTNRFIAHKNSIKFSEENAKKIENDVSQILK